MRVFFYWITPSTGEYLITQVGQHFVFQFSAMLRVKKNLIFSVIIAAMVLNDYLPDTLTLHTYFNSLNSRLGDLGHLGLGDGRLVLIQ